MSDSLPPVARECTISVVIATRDRPGSLRDVARQVIGQLSERDELIVVDDHPDSIGSYDWLPANGRLLRSSGRGPAVARNLGWRAAAGEVVAFTDDDVTIGGDWLGGIRGAFAGCEELVAAEGRTVSRPFDRLYEYSVSSDAAGNGLTCNVAYRRSVLARLGGFDEGFKFAHCEDVDLFTRARSVGPVQFSERMRVEHLPRALAPNAIARRGGWLESERRLYAKHPGLRPHRLPATLCAVVVYLRWPLDTFAVADVRLRDGPQRLARALLISVLWWWQAARATARLLRDYPSAPGADAFSLRR